MSASNPGDNPIPSASDNSRLSVLDPLSQQLFGARDFELSYKAGEGDEDAEASVHNLERELFGRVLSALDYAELIGAPTDSEISISVTATNDQIEIESRTHKYDLRQIVQAFSLDDDLALYIDYCGKSPDSPPGIAARLIARQVDEAYRRGVKSIQLHAVGSPGDPKFNGYYTWPRLGFDGALSDIPGMLEKATTAGYSGVKTLNALFSSPGGAAWWHDNGNAIFCEFDLQPGSKSREILDVYLKERGVVAHD